MQLISRSSAMLCTYIVGLLPEGHGLAVVAMFCKHDESIELRSDFEHEALEGNTVNYFQYKVYTKRTNFSRRSAVMLKK